MPFVQLEKKHLHLYQLSQGVLYLSTFALVFFLVLRSLFPVTLDIFDFDNPSSRDNSLIPHENPANISITTTGKMPSKESIVFNLGASAEDSQAHFNLLINKKSPLPKDIALTIRHGYQAAWLPKGEPIKDFPARDFYTLDGVYYQRTSERTLDRFVSETAFLSRYPKEFAKPLTHEEFATYNLSENVIGFRPGVLTAYGEGVFIIMNDKEMRPVGSARIFQDLGYRFEDVQKISAEELGIYERGKIFLSGDRHPDGTLFQDTDSDQFFLVDQEELHEVLPGRYLDFLLSKTRPVLFSTKESLSAVSCQMIPNTFSYGIHCDMPITTISASTGSNYEIMITNNGGDVHLNKLEARFTTAKNQNNLHFILAQIKDTFLTRFGLN